MHYLNTWNRHQSSCMRQIVSCARSKLFVRRGACLYTERVRVLPIATNVFVFKRAGGYFGFLWRAAERKAHCNSHRQQQGGGHRFHVVMLVRRGERRSKHAWVEGTLARSISVWWNKQKSSSRTHHTHQRVFEVHRSGRAGGRRPLRKQLYSQSRKDSRSTTSSSLHNRPILLHNQTNYPTRGPTKTPRYLQWSRMLYA